MQKWEMTFCNKGDIKRYLASGWEPFAVTAEIDSSVQALNYQHTVWLRKPVSLEIEKEV